MTIKMTDTGKNIMRVPRPKLSRKMISDKRGVNHSSPRIRELRLALIKMGTPFSKRLRERGLTALINKENNAEFMKRMSRVMSRGVFKGVEKKNIEKIAQNLADEASLSLRSRNIGKPQKRVQKAGLLQQLIEQGSDLLEDSKQKKNK